MIFTYICLVITNYIIPLRVTEDDEEVGLDCSMHDETLNDQTLEMLKKLIKDIENKKIIINNSNSNSNGNVIGNGNGNSNRNITIENNVNPLAKVSRFEDGVELSSTNTNDNTN